MREALGAVFNQLVRSCAQLLFLEQLFVPSRSKRGRAWAGEAASLQEADPARLEREIRVFKRMWESKRQTAYARWVRAEWSLYANGGWNRRRKTRCGTVAKVKIAGGTGRGTGNLVISGERQRPRDFENRFSRP